MDTPTRGSILFEREDLAKASKSCLTSYRRSEVGFVFQFYNLIPDLTALENAAVASEFPEKSLRLAGVPDQVGMAGGMDHFPPR
jgi:putative ABC transport system ATP-binding protein